MKRTIVGLLLTSLLATACFTESSTTQFELQVLRTDLANVRERLSETEKRLSEAENQNGNLRIDLANVKERLSETEKRLGEAENQVESFEQSLTVPEGANLITYEEATEEERELFRTLMGCFFNADISSDPNTMEAIAKEVWDEEGGISKEELLGLRIWVATGCP